MTLGEFLQGMNNWVKGPCVNLKDINDFNIRIGLKHPTSGDTLLFPLDRLQITITGKNGVALMNPLHVPNSKEDSVLLRLTLDNPQHVLESDKELHLTAPSSEEMQ